VPTANDPEQTEEHTEGDGRRTLRVTRSLTIPTSELNLRFAPSGGPGGQHANRASTRVELRFDVEHSRSLGPNQRSRLLQRLGPEVRIVADRHRSQARNREEALERLRDRLASALSVPRPRTPTRPSRSAVERRLEDKRRRAERKRSRRPPSED
jgi:ribosome-associated protein